MSVEHIIKPNGDQFWYMDGKKHREDGPAVIYAVGDQGWKLNSPYHGADEPDRFSDLWGVVWQEWWINGMRHREDGPAIVRSNGDQEWWINNKRHRNGGPAVICTQIVIYQEWWINGKKHREDGPAVITNYFVAYYNKGVKLKEELYNCKIHEKYKFKSGSKTKAALRENSIN